MGVPHNGWFIMENPITDKTAIATAAPGILRPFQAIEAFLRHPRRHGAASAAVLAARLAVPEAPGGLKQRSNTKKNRCGIYIYIWLINIG